MNKVFRKVTEATGKITDDQEAQCCGIGERLAPSSHWSEWFDPAWSEDPGKEGVGCHPDGALRGRWRITVEFEPDDPEEVERRLSVLRERGEQ